MRFAICATKSQNFRPKLKSWTKLKIINKQKVLLYPEGKAVLNDSGYDILKICNGKNTLHDIVSQLSQEYETQMELVDIEDFINFAQDQMWIEK